MGMVKAHGGNMKCWQTRDMRLRGVHGHALRQSAVSLAERLTPARRPLPAQLRHSPASMATEAHLNSTVHRTTSTER